jgi:outer membrane protein OmpA-like peptidoglycan-associated protein
MSASPIPTTKVRFGALAVLVALGCASAERSSQLQEARSAVLKAERSRAHTWAPEDLREAQHTLLKAERREPGSLKERHLAYLADRHARIAMARANSAYEQQRLQSAEQEYIVFQERGRKRAEHDLELLTARLRDTVSDLGKIHLQLQEEGADVPALRDRRSALEMEEAKLRVAIAEREAVLAGAPEDRAHAEHRAIAALAGLERIARLHRTEDETRLTLESAALFRPGDHRLIPFSRYNLARVADALKNIANDELIIVVGHTDSVGSAESNRKLSLDRAAGVRVFLIERGIDADRVYAVGKGESEPIADNVSSEGRANNRRVELLVRDRVEPPRQQDLASR